MRRDGRGHRTTPTGTGRVHGAALARLAYRRGQAALLLLLAVLLVAAAATGPLYERAVEQASVTSVLRGSDVVGRGLEVVLDDTVPASDVTLSGRAQDLFDPPVAGTDVPAQFATARYPRLSTTLTARDRECTELVLAAGVCPTVPDQVMVSTSLAAAVGLRLGQVLPVRIPTLSNDRSNRQQLLVVGLYRPFSSQGPYWFGHPYSTTTGVTESGDGLTADAVFGATDYVDQLADQLQASLPGTVPRRTVDLALRPDAVHVEDLPVLRATIDRFQDNPQSANISVVTGLGDDLDTIDAQRDDARTVVLVLAVQLAALAAIALGVVVAAATDQRRPELALLRLRGLGRGRTAVALTRELGTVVVVAIVPGVALAWLLTLAASAAWLREGVRPELRVPVVVAAAAAVVVGVAVVLGVAWRTVRSPISALLRQVAQPTRGGLGLVEVAVAVVAVAGLVTSFSQGGSDAAEGGGGDGGSPLALLTPTCVAVLLGVLASRLVEVLARRSGRRQLARGAVARGLALLAIARRSGARLTVVILAVATGLVVFAGQQTGVASAARAERAAAVTGAPVVLQTSAPDAPTFLAAVRAADPDGRYASPVVVVRPPGVGSEPVVAVDPASFGAVASWGRADLRPSAAGLRALSPGDTVPSVTVTTTALTLELSSVSWTRLPGAAADDIDPDAPVAAPSVSLAITLQHPDGRTSTATFGPLPSRSPAGGVRLTSALACTDGCRLAGMAFTRPVLDSSPLTLDLQIAALTTAAGDTVDLGPGSAWGTVTPATDVAGTSTPLSMTVGDGATSSGVEVTAVDAGGQAATQHLDVPVAAPVLAAGPPPTNTDSAGAVTAATLSGGTGPVHVVGSVPFVPQVGAPALLVDLDLAARIGPVLDATATPSVWLAADDPARESALVAALRARGVDVLSRSTTADLEVAYGRTAPGWSNQLALIVGVLAELLAVLLVVLVVLTGRRVRQRDLAGLRLVGIDRRTLQRSTRWELGLLVSVGMLAGVVAGLIGVELALPSVPVFVSAPPVPLPVVHPWQWWWLVGAVGLGLVLLVPTVVLIARRLVAGARPARVSGDER